MLVGMVVLLYVWLVVVVLCSLGLFGVLFFGVWCYGGLWCGGCSVNVIMFVFYLLMVVVSLVLVMVVSVLGWFEFG